MIFFCDTEAITLFVVFVDPEAEPLEMLGPDAGEHDESCWLVFNALHTRTGIRKHRMLRLVRRDVMQWMEDRAGNRYDDDTAETLADVHIRSAIMRPDSPFGLGLKINADATMHVVFRGDCYWRDKRGVLTAEPSCRCGVTLGWPSPEEWGLRFRIMRVWAEHEGLA